jgi:hypothetical protein
MAITIERNAITGAYVATALVVDNETPYTNYAWYEHQTYYGYSKGEIKTLFKQYLVKKNYSIVKGN